MKNIVIAAAIIGLLSPFASFADSNVTATGDAHSFITPSGLTVVPTGDTQTFTVGADNGYKVTDVTVDGISHGAVNSVDFTGVDLDTTDHTIGAVSMSVGSGQAWCSGPTAPGWNVSLPGGGCNGGSYFAIGESVTVSGVTYTCPAYDMFGCQLPKN